MPIAAVGGAQEAFEIAKMHADSWARSHGLDVEALNVQSIAGSDGMNGVVFDVIVGRGDIALDQRQPGALDNWRWSGPRVEWWRRIFNRSDGRQGRRLAARDDVSQRVVRGPWRGAEALRGPDRGEADRLGLGPLLEPAPVEPHKTVAKGAMTGREPGCTCPLGGPFVEICPVHFEIDR